MTEHPSAETLARWQVSPDAWTAINDHVQKCPICEKALGESQARTDPLAPDVFPNLPGYEILEELNRGGMGVVYRARQPALKRVVAIKRILPGEEAIEDVQQRFQSEGESIARLQRADIVQAFDFCAHEGRWFLVMEFCAGGSLADRLERNPLPPRDAAALVQALAAAVQATHEVGIVHRDLKPGNVLFDSAGMAKIADFGLARRVDQPGLTASGTVVGTASYMSPEQARGESVDARADVYSLGAVLYECLTGRPPFQAATTVQTLLQVLNDEPVSPRELNRAVDRGLAFVCMRCLEKDPRRRYRSAADLAADLGRWINGEGPVLPGFIEGVSRQFQIPCRVDRPGEWANTCFALAGWRGVCHGMMLLLLQWNVAPGVYWAWFIGLHAGVWVLVGLLRSERRLDQAERGLLLNWAATTAADALLLGLFCSPWGPTRPEEVVRVYPAWLTVHGLSYVMEARRLWGRCYAVGFGFLFLVPVLSFFGLLAPLAYALINIAMLVWMGDGLRRLPVRQK